MFKLDKTLEAIDILKGLYNLVPEIPIESINNRVKKLTSFYFDRQTTTNSNLERAAIYTKNNRIRPSMANAESLLISPSISRGSTLFVFNKETSNRRSIAPHTINSEKKNILVTDHDLEEDNQPVDTLETGRKLL